jgi:hypothetical protein
MPNHHDVPMEHDIPLMSGPFSYGSQVEPFARSAIRRKPLATSTISEKKIPTTQQDTRYVNVPIEDENEGSDHKSEQMKTTTAAQVTELDEDHAEERSEAQPSWQPTVLTWQWIAVFLIYGILLLIGITFVQQISRRSDGLADDVGSRGQFVAWRFLPTLCAIIYTTML